MIINSIEIHQALFFLQGLLCLDETNKYCVLCNMGTRKQREEYRLLGSGEYHFCTDGWKDGDIFHDVAQFAFGMILMGLIVIKYPITIYAFTLMHNHIHIILRGTGADCLAAFDYLKRKLSARLKKDGFVPLPEDYWFHLTPITSPEQMKGEIIYVLRNPLEEGMAIVGGYIWSSGWLYHSRWKDLLGSAPAMKVSTRELRKLLGGDEKVPDNWRFHPYLGLHPTCFVDTSMALKLFPDAKDLQTALVKDYEVCFQIASRLGEVCKFNKAEQESIVSQTLQKRFNGKSINAMTEEDKGKLAIILNREFGFTSYQISTTIYLKEKVIRQLLASKELR